MPATHTVVAQDAAEEEAKASADLFQLLKADFTELRDTLAPHYLALSDTARQNLKNRFEITAWTNPATTDQQRNNSLGYACAVLFLGMDYLERRERGD